MPAAARLGKTGSDGGEGPRYPTAEGPSLYRCPNREDDTMGNDDFNRVKEQARIRDYCEAKLQRQGQTYVCPACGSGTGKHKTSAFSLKGEAWRCFSCLAGGDVFDLAGIVTGNESKRAELEEVAGFFGVSLEKKESHVYGWDDPAKVDGWKPTKPGGKAPTPTGEPKAQPTQGTKADAATVPPTDYSAGREAHRAYIKACKAAMPGSDGESYLLQRGMTAEEIARFGIGYDAGVRRVVFPWSDNESEFYHVDRTTIEPTEKAITRGKPKQPGQPIGERVAYVTGHKYEKPYADEVGPQPIYNAAAIGKPCVFVVEGIMDAIAVRACGYEATALFSTGGHAQAASIAAGATGAVVVMLDGDEAGRKGAAALMEDLDGKVPFAMTAEVPGAKDAGELFQRDRAALAAFLERTQAQALQAREDARGDEYLESLRALRPLDPLDVVMRIRGLEGFANPIPTGFTKLDEALNGGLRPGLIVFGAGSSSGKTTFWIQAADRMAEAGHKVLFVTIEQSATEITAKSISRIMSGAGAVCTCTDLVTPKVRASWGEPMRAALDAAAERYAVEVGANLRILEGLHQPKVTDIRAAAEEMAAQNGGVAPIVIVDYLQLIAGIDERDSDKTRLDRNVTQLRVMARELKAPVICISSVSRAKYYEPFSMESVKESGGIEYGADVVMGLQPANFAKRLDGVEDKKREWMGHQVIEEWKDSNPRDSEVVIVKQRAGRVPKDGIRFAFNAMSSEFTEGGQAYGWDDAVTL